MHEKAKPTPIKYCEYCGKKLERKDFIEFLSRYTLTDKYGDKEYAFSMDLINKGVENAWAKAVASKTRAYQREMYGRD